MVRHCRRPSFCLTARRQALVETRNFGRKSIESHVVPRPLVQQEGCRGGRTGMQPNVMKSSAKFDAPQKGLPVPCDGGVKSTLLQSSVFDCL